MKLGKRDVRRRLHRILCITLHFLVGYGDAFSLASSQTVIWIGATVSLWKGVSEGVRRTVFEITRQGVPLSQKVE